jgi:transcriptional regulator with XRE-family HTH domain
MYLGERLRQLRQSKGLSQREIQKRTGLRRCYISRLENDHTVPAVATLEKMSRALGIATYQIFYKATKPEQIVSPAKAKPHDWASHGKGFRIFTKIQHALSHMTVEDRALLLYLAEELVKDRGGPHS